MEDVQAAVETAPVIDELTKPKRQYVKVDKAEFIKIANAHGNIRGIMEGTGMSYAGVKSKLKALKAGKVALKSSLFERQKRKSA